MLGTLKPISQGSTSRQQLKAVHPPMAMLVYCVKIGTYLRPIMALQAILVHSTAQGGTIHKFPVKQGERFLGCYLGTCKFSNNLAEATADLSGLDPSVNKSES